MFKCIPGNSEYLISINGLIVATGGVERTIHSSGNYVRLTMYGKERMVDRTWLAMLSHYEVELPPQFHPSIFSNINFTDYDSSLTRSLANKLMYFNKPMVLFGKYRIIPNFTRYAVSKEGEVYDCRFGKIIQQSKCYSYPGVNIYNPDRSGARNVYVHRLVALAWIKNTEPVTKPVVNHKDGNKQHFHCSNLEWVSYTENSIHAVNTGLRTDNLHCKVFDAIEKKEYEFYSVKQACGFMGISGDTPITNIIYKTKHKLINDRYEVKRFEDNSPWFYENRPIGSVSGRYHIKVTKENDVVEEHPDVRTFKQVFKVWNVNGIGDIISKAQKMYPDWTFSYTDNYNLRPVQMYNVQTGEVIEAEGIRQLCKITGLAYSVVYNYLNLGETRVYKDFAFRYKSDKPWNTDFKEYRCRSMCVLITHRFTNEVLTFKSLRKTAEYFKVDRSIIKRFITNGKYFRMWKIIEFEI